MDWYYAINGQRLGPADDALLDKLVAAGTIKADTLVWRDGMADWKPLEEARNGAAEVAAPGGRCSHCEQPFPSDELVSIGDRTVCTNCKPVVLQQLLEGTLRLHPQAFKYGGFRLRFGAKCVDLLVIALPIYGLKWIVAFVMFKAMAPKTDSEMLRYAYDFMGVVLVFYMVFCMAFSGFFLGRYGATPGKMACGLKVIRKDGSKTTFWRGAARFLGEFVSAMICFVGYFLALSDGEKRTLHDHVCGTRVVMK